ncbi:MAG: Nif3-like dinuclear metal center hexameric protein [Chloroflexi bacterium]|nr:Nif3-like dinuclear metal center hexameric protein [Chloroflexota bacterium]MBP8056416.1 Nif3-like dinuclear metal center hexameric protein [Chloroflexota bacterium]
MQKTDLLNYLNAYLHIDEIKDYGPQGLQVEADKSEIHKVALGVDVSPAIIQAAAAWEADMLLVHHGILWRNVERLNGALGQRVRLLLKHNIHLYAAHLPLDAHPEIGNNSVLAHMFGVAIENWWCSPTNVPIGIVGHLHHPLPVTDLVAQINEKLHTQARLLAHGPAQAERVAILSGFGADEVAEVKKLGADTYITGETSHAHYWAASDYALNVIFAGHYASEMVGVQALGQHLTAQFGLETRFFDFPTGL